MSSHCIYTEHMIVITFRWADLAKQNSFYCDVKKWRANVWVCVLFLFSINFQSLYRIKSTIQRALELTRKSLFLCFGFSLFAFPFFVYCSRSRSVCACVCCLRKYIHKTFSSPHLNCFRLFNPFGIIYREQLFFEKKLATRMYSTCIYYTTLCCWLFKTNILYSCMIQSSWDDKHCCAQSIDILQIIVNLVNHVTVMCVLCNNVELLVRRNMCTCICMPIIVDLLRLPRYSCIKFLMKGNLHRYAVMYKKSFITKGKTL